MRQRRTTALPVALTENLDHFYEPTPSFYEDEVPTNDDHCFMAPKDVLGRQRTALDSPPPLRRLSRDISTIPPTALPKRLLFPDF
jgi:hypothetical protein